jgi:hypothetical protein
MKTYIAVAFCLSSCIARSQVADSAFGYFPLMTGDIWEYDCQTWPFENHLYYFTETVTGDSVAPNGVKYFVIYRKILPDSSTIVYLERVDSLTANVYTYQPTPYPTEVLQDSLRSKPGDHYDGGYGICWSQHTQSILGVPTTVKSFTFAGLESHDLAYGFGEDSVNIFNNGDSFGFKLIYARIAGKEFGTLLSVQSTKTKPSDFSLSQNFPNPFNPSTSIEFSLPQMEFITLEVRNILGQRIATLISKVMPPGSHVIKFDGSGLPTGTYYCILRTKNSLITKPMLLIK